MYNFGKSVNTIVIPDLSESIILDTVKKIEQEYTYKKNDQLYESLDFYYQNNLDEYIEEWFATDSLQQVPPFPQAVVSRFARARMMLYKSDPERLIANEINQDYNDITYRLNT